MDSYLQRQIRQSDCKISSNFGEKWLSTFQFCLVLLVRLSVNLQDAFICLHVFCNYCQLSGSKIWFPLSFFCTVSGELFRVHVYTDTEKFSPSLPS